MLVIFIINKLVLKVLLSVRVRGQKGLSTKSISSIKDITRFYPLSNAPYAMSVMIDCEYKCPLKN